MKPINQILSALWFCCTLFACQQMPEDDDWDSGDETQELKVKVRSASDAEIVYPIYLYAFSENGGLAASQTIGSEEKEMSLVLDKGEYQIVAVSGTSKAYQLPEQPTLDDVITLTGTQGAETPLMMGKADVNISQTQEPTVEMTLTYTVAALNVILKDVPTNISEVQLSLSPLHSTLSMAGTYGGETQKVKINCTSTSEGTWAAPTTYIFPGSGKETVFSIYFKSKEGTETTYGYTYKGAPEANRPFNVTGSYSGGVIVGGSFDISDWGEAINVEFTFGANIVPDNNEDDDEPEIDLSKVPEIGTIWNDAIVADIGEADETSVELLLMSLDEWEDTATEASNIPDGYTVNGIPDWRSPTHDEAAMLRARFSDDARTELNDLIADYDPSLYGLANGEKERYLCLKGDVFYSFRFVSGTTTTKAGEKRTYYIRLVRTYRISLQ